MVDLRDKFLSLPRPQVQGRLIYFRLFLLSRKASNAITKLPKAISKANIPMKIEMISKAVICATSPLMYSGKPGMKFWEATNLQHDYPSLRVYHILSFLTIPRFHFIGLFHEGFIDYFPNYKVKYAL